MSAGLLIRVAMRGHFGNPLGSCTVIRTRHSHLAAEAFHGPHNTFVVRRYNYLVRPPGQLRPLVDPLDHGFSS